jgi:hypothetical protein
MKDRSPTRQAAATMEVTMPEMIQVTIDLNHVHEIERRIFEAVADDEFFHRLEALVNMITLHLSAFDCPTCRETIAEQLKQRIPSMLAEASDIAGTRKEEGGPWICKR